MTEALEQVKKRLLQDCKAYVRNRKWQAAAATCEKHMVLACPSIPREELVPPVGYTLSLRPRRDRNEWKPENADFLRFLDARQRAGLGGEPWECPVSDILVVEVEENSPKKIIEAELAKRYEDKIVRRAMLEYWEGKAGEAGALLQKVRNTVEKAALHAEVDQLKRDVENVFQLYQNGQAALQEDDPERAAPVLRRGAGAGREADARALLRSSSPRSIARAWRRIWRPPPTSAAASGPTATTPAGAAACGSWASPSSPGTSISTRPSATAPSWPSRRCAGADSCDALPEVFDLAVSGDGVRELAEARKTELGCL